MSFSLVQLAELIGSDGRIAAMGVLFFFGVGELIHRWATGYHRVPHYKLRATTAHLHPQSDVPEAVVLGPTAPSVEPQPASREGGDAGTNLQSGLSRLESGRRRDPSGEQPHPAPGTVVDPGAGPTPPTGPVVSDVEAPRHAHHLPGVGREGIPAGSFPHRSLPAGPTTRVTAAPPPPHGAVGDPDRDTDTDTHTPVSVSPTQRPAADGDPDSAAAGLPPRPGAGPSGVAADGPARSVA